MCFTTLVRHFVRTSTHAPSNRLGNQGHPALLDTRLRPETTTGLDPEGKPWLDGSGISPSNSSDADSRSDEPWKRRQKLILGASRRQRRMICANSLLMLHCVCALNGAWLLWSASRARHLKWWPFGDVESQHVDGLDGHLTRVVLRILSPGTVGIVALVWHSLMSLFVCLRPCGLTAPALWETIMQALVVTYTIIATYNAMHWQHHTPSHGEEFDLQGRIPDNGDHQGNHLHSRETSGPFFCGEIALLVLMSNQVAGLLCSFVAQVLVWRVGKDDSRKEEDEKRAEVEESRVRLDA